MHTGDGPDVFTSAYPHAFAVPEHKMGGNYNYMVRRPSIILNHLKLHADSFRKDLRVVRSSVLERYCWTDQPLAAENIGPPEHQFGDDGTAQDSIFI